MGAVLPTAFRIVHQVQIGLIQERGGLERVAYGLPAHVMVREPMQFGMHQRKQFRQRFLVTVAPRAEQLRDRLSR